MNSLILMRRETRVLADIVMRNMLDAYLAQGRRLILLHWPGTIAPWAHFGDTYIQRVQGCNGSALASPEEFVGIAKGQDSFFEGIGGLQRNDVLVFSVSAKALVHSGVTTAMSRLRSNARMNGVEIDIVFVLGTGDGFTGEAEEPAQLGPALSYLTSTFIQEPGGRRFRWGYLAGDQLGECLQRYPSFFEKSVQLTTLAHSTELKANHEACWQVAAPALSASMSDGTVAENAHQMPLPTDRNVVQADRRLEDKLIEVMSSKAPRTGERLLPPAVLLGTLLSWPVAWLYWLVTMPRDPSNPMPALPAYLMELGAKAASHTSLAVALLFGCAGLALSLLSRARGNDQIEQLLEGAAKEVSAGLLLLSLATVALLHTFAGPLWGGGFLLAFLALCTGDVLAATVLRVRQRQLKYRLAAIGGLNSLKKAL